MEKVIHERIKPDGDISIDTDIFLYNSLQVHGYSGSCKNFLSGVESGEIGGKGFIKKTPDVFLTSDAIILATMKHPKNDHSSN